MTRQQQIDHIKNTKLNEFQSVFGRDTVEEYFDEYFKKYSDPQELYHRLCDDLDLVPEK